MALLQIVCFLIIHGLVNVSLQKTDARRGIAQKTLVNPKMQTISVSKPNGARYGVWSDNWEICWPGTRAVGFALKTEPYLGEKVNQDDTSINGLALLCSDGQTRIIGDEAPFGKWGPEYRCCPSRNGMLVAFKMSYDAPDDKSKSRSDDIGVDDFVFKCKAYNSSGWDVWEQSLPALNGPTYPIDHNRIKWTDWSEECPKGICGLRTQVDVRKIQLPHLDLNGLHNVHFMCCD